MDAANDSGEYYDVIIVGGGIMGSSTAYQTSKRGLKTLLLEQYDFLHHRGSSHGETRTIRATYIQDYYYPLVMESYDMWRQAQAQIGYQVYYPAQHLDMAHESDPKIHALISNCRKQNIPHQVLRRRETAEKFFGVFSIPEDWIAVSTPHGGVIKPTKATAMYQTLAVKHNAVLRDNTQVTDIKKENNGIITIFTASGKTYRGKKCVITVGAWMRKLVKRVSGAELPIKVLDTHVCYWRVKAGEEEKFELGGAFPTFASYGETCLYGTPVMEYPGLVKVAVHGGRECDEGRREWWGEGWRMEELKGWVERTFGGRVDATEAVVKQACMYSMTPGDDFVVDFLGGRFGRDVVVGGGFSGHGFKMAPVVGRVLAELAVDGEAKGVDLSPFRISRFVQVSRI